MTGEYLGDFAGTETLLVTFDSFDANGASVTIGGFALADIEIVKATQVSPGFNTSKRSSTNGIFLLDTSGVDIGGASPQDPGIHGFTIDLSDNTDAGFYATGADYNVWVNAVLIGSPQQTVRFVAARFSIQNRYMRGTNSALLASSAPTNFSDLSISATTGRIDVGEWLGTAVTTSATTSKPEVDVYSVSDDATAANNIESTYDGTGYSDDVAPATQSQLGSLSTGSAAISVQSESYVLTTGTQSSGLFSDTSTVDGVRHEHTDTAGTLDLYYQFDVTGSGVATDVKFNGRINGANDSLDGVYAYNWAGASWDRIGDLLGTSSSTDSEFEYNLLVRHTGTGANLGKVRIRFYAASGLTSATLRIDRITTGYTVVSNSVGYDNGSIWIDTNNGVAGTEPFVNGVADNPVSTISDALTLSSSLNLKRLAVANGSSITFSQAFTNWIIDGHEYDIALGGQDISETMFIDADVSGVSTGTGAEFQDGFCGNVTIGPSNYYNTSFTGTFTCDSAGDYSFINCQSGVAGSGSPTFDLGAIGATTVEFRRWSGGVTINNIASGDVLTISGELGTVTLNGADGQVEIRGTYKAITDNRTGSPTLNKAGAINEESLVDATWDEVISSAAHNTAQSAGQRLRQSGRILAVEGSVVVSSPDTNSTSQFTTDLTESSSSFYADQTLVFTGGALEGQARIVTSYNGTTKVVTFDEPWTTTPGSGDSFEIRADHIHPVSEITADIDANSTQLAAIVADTNELQADWADDGRLDLILDARSTQASVDTIDSNVDAILVDTADMQPKLGTPAVDISADIASIQTDTNAIEVDTQDIQSRIPAALVSGKMDSDVTAINSSATAAAQLALSSATIVNSTATATTLSTTQMSTNLTEATDDHYIGRIIIWTSGVLQNQATDITDYNGTTKTLTFTATTEAPSAADAFIIV